jgi:hypothetical protein
VRCALLLFVCFAHCNVWGLANRWDRYTGTHRWRFGFRGEDIAHSSTHGTWRNSLFSEQRDRLVHVVSTSLVSNYACIPLRSSRGELAVLAGYSQSQCTLLFPFNCFLLVARRLPATRGLMPRLFEQGFLPLGVEFIGTAQAQSLAHTSQAAIYTAK